MSTLSETFNSYLTGLFGLRIVRVDGFDKHLVQKAGTIQSLTNDPTAIDRICRLGQLLRPQQAQGVKKVRVGGNNDGGYVCLDDFKGISTALSLGIGDNVSWDADMAGRGLTVYQYDHTVAGAPLVHSNFRFNRRKIAAEAAQESETIASALSRNLLARPLSVIMKIDIEDDEWAVFAATPTETLDTFVQVVCELHGFERVIEDHWFERAFDVLRKLNDRFAIVHVHANNYRPLLGFGNILFPQAVEITYANRAKYTFSESDEVFPGKLDAPNWPAAVDYNLGKFHYA